MKPASIETQYNELVWKAFKENRTTNAAPYPAGYFKSQSRSGTALGLGFYCPDCKLVILNGAATVKHCKRVDMPPTGFWPRLRLNTFQLGSRRSV